MKILRLIGGSVYSEISMVRAESIHLVKNLNSIVDVFHKYQSFSKLTESDQAFEYVSSPLAYFDKAIIEGVGLKPIAGTSFNPEQVAKMYNIDRMGFISSLILPTYGALGNAFRVELPTSKKHWFEWTEGLFTINNDALQLDIEKHITYAVSEAHHELLAYWVNIAEMLNIHNAKGLLPKFELYLIAKALGVVFVNEKFEPYFRGIADKIKKMK